MALSAEEWQTLLASAGATKTYAKILAPNDNSKNQIYLAGDPAQLSTLKPGKFQEDDQPGGILKAAVRFSWLAPDGTSYRAPNAQLIFYPQYPEVRLSGILRGTDWAPRSLISSRDEGRVLFLGVRSDGEIIAAADKVDPTLGSLLDPDASVESGTLRPLRTGTTTSSRELLLERLRSLHGKGWVDAKALRANGSVVPCKGPRCVGCTLESELGIAQNGFCGPDFLDWELKAITWKHFAKPELSKPVTLMTPAPTGGVYREAGGAGFVRRFGYADLSGKADRMNFGGRFFFGLPEPRTGLTLTLDGFDLKSSTFPEGGGLSLRTSSGDLAAHWSYSELASRWAIKHANACYVPAQKCAAGSLKFRYGREVYLGSEPRLSYFFKSIVDGSIFFDPGIKLENASSPNAKIKERHQFRAKFIDTSRLYQFYSQVDLLQ